MDPDEHKEQVFREMQLEALQQEVQQTAVNGDEIAVKKGIPFSGMEMLKQAAFGGCIGR